MRLIWQWNDNEYRLTSNNYKKVCVNDGETNGKAYFNHGDYSITIIGVNKRNPIR